MIPKTIYQTWYSKDFIPQEYQTILYYNQHLLPDYEFILMDNHDMDHFFQTTPEIPSRYRKIYYHLNPHYGPARADFFRYLIIYLYGGIYMDIKVRILQPFSQWIRENEEAILSQWDSIESRELQNWHIIYRPKHPFLQAVLDKICDAIENALFSDRPLDSLMGKQAVLEFTGPYIYTSTLQSLIGKGGGERILNISSYLDYGRSFFGLARYEEPYYVHYTKLSEPLLMRAKGEIPFVVNVPSKNWQEEEGVHLPFGVSRWRIDPTILFGQCDVFVALEDGIVIVLAYHKGVDLSLLHSLMQGPNIEKVFYEKGFCIIRARVDLFERQVYFGYVPCLSF